MKLPKGKFVVLEGGDESGKTTHGKWLAKIRNGIFTFEPRDELNLRSMLLSGSQDIAPHAEALLFAADRAQHMHTIIEPALMSGKDVICDRFTGSSIAYQGHGRGLDAESIRLMSEFSAKGIRPDIVLLLDISYEEYMRRRELSDNADTKFDVEEAEFHKKVLRGYREIAEQNPDTWVVIDGERPLGNVREDILKTLEIRLA